ncbi:MAG: CYCXC family (seleno)protein [Deltaproteobacteria bacterium]
MNLAYRHYILKGGVALFLLIMSISSCKVAGEKAMTPESIRGGETRETMSPLYFTGSVRDAYQIAKEIPDVLDGLHCYCECKKNFGHKSLLTCYVDEHAKHCDLCLNEAFMAGELHRQGMDAVSIRKAVDKRFSNQGH